MWISSKFVLGGAEISFQGLRLRVRPPTRAPLRPSPPYLLPEAEAHGARTVPILASSLEER